MVSFQPSRCEVAPAKVAQWISILETRPLARVERCCFILSAMELRWTTVSRSGPIHPQHQGRRDLRAMESLHFERLKAERQSSIRVNSQMAL